MKSVPVTLWVQKWEESEAGWGVRPDGFTLHRHRDDIALFLDRMRASEEAQGYGAGHAPSEYSRPDGDPYVALIADEALITALCDSECGIWGPGRDYPPPVTTGSDRTGWVPVEKSKKPDGIVLKGIRLIDRQESPKAILEVYAGPNNSRVRFHADSSAAWAAAYSELWSGTGWNVVHSLLTPCAMPSESIAKLFKVTADILDWK